MGRMAQIRSGGRVMSDLISRSALLEEIKRELERGRANDPFFDGTLFHYTGIKAIIENQPTAYDVDKVVKELENISAEVFGTFKFLDLERTIEIVKGGGVNERD